jgi:hypothetical protein
MNDSGIKYTGYPSKRIEEGKEQVVCGLPFKTDWVLGREIEFLTKLIILGINLPNPKSRTIHFCQII